MLKIVTGADNPVLRTRCDEIEVFDEALESLAQEMVETMIGDQEEVRGVGLAANQVGILQRIMVVTFNMEKPKTQKIVVMINPEIVELSQKEVKMEEGCLSLPGEFAEIARPSWVKARWQNVQGVWSEKKLSSWDARVFLHEYDHLEGKMFVDYL